MQATRTPGCEQEPSDHPVDVARRPRATWLKKSSLDICTLWGARGVCGFDSTKVFRGWTPDEMQNSEASGLHGNSELGRERGKAEPGLLGIGL